MIKNLAYIGFTFVILGEIIFSEYAPGRSTNWSVFYYSSLYLGLFVISIKDIIYSTANFDKALSVIFSLFFITMSVNMIMKIGMDYDSFIISVNDNFIDTVRYLLLGLTGGLISIKHLKSWARHSQK